MERPGIRPPPAPDALALYQGHGAGPGSLAVVTSSSTGRDIAPNFFTLSPASQCRAQSSMKATQATIGSSGRAPGSGSRTPRPAGAAGRDDLRTLLDDLRTRVSGGVTVALYRLSPGGGRYQVGNDSRSTPRPAPPGGSSDSPGRWYRWMDPSVTDRRRSKRQPQRP